MPEEGAPRSQRMTKREQGMSRDLCWAARLLQNSGQQQPNPSELPLQDPPPTPGAVRAPGISRYHPHLRHFKDLLLRPMLPTPQEGRPLHQDPLPVPPTVGPSRGKPAMGPLQQSPTPWHCSPALCWLLMSCQQSPFLRAKTPVPRASSLTAGHPILIPGTSAPSLQNTITDLWTHGTAPRNPCTVPQSQNTASSGRVGMWR